MIFFTSVNSIFLPVFVCVVFDSLNFKLNVLLAEVRQQLKWADGKLVKSEIDQQVSHQLCIVILFLFAVRNVQSRHFCYHCYCFENITFNCCAPYECWSVAFATSGAIF